MWYILHVTCIIGSSGVFTNGAATVQLAKGRDRAHYVFSNILMGPHVCGKVLRAQPGTEPYEAICG